MLTLNPSIGMPKERFMTRFQRDQVDRLFWDELKQHSSEPHKFKGQSDSPYASRAKELKTPKLLGDEYQNLGAEMRSMVGVKPNPRLAQHKHYHDRWTQISEKVCVSPISDEEKSSVSQGAKKKIDSLRDEDDDWIVQYGPALAFTLGDVSELASQSALVLSIAGFALSLTGAGATIGVPLATAGLTFSVSSVALKFLQSAVLSLDPNAATGSGKAAFKSAVVDGALLGAGHVIGKVAAGAKDLASTERVRGLAFLKDWRGSTLGLMMKIDKFTKFINSHLKGAQIGRIFGPSGLLMGSPEVKARAFKHLDFLTKALSISEIVSGLMDQGEKLVKIFLGVATSVKEGISDGVDAVGEFIEGTGVRLTDAIRDAAEQLIHLGLVGPELLARWGVATGQRILSAGQRAVIGTARRVGASVASGVRRGARSVGRFVVHFAQGVSSAVLAILVNAKLLVSRVLATGETVYECISEAAYRVVNRILAFLHPTAEITVQGLQHVMMLISVTMGRAGSMGSALMQLVMARAGRLFGASAHAVGNLSRRIAEMIGATGNRTYDLIFQILQSGRRFGEGVLTPVLNLFSGLVDRVGRRVVDLGARPVGALSRLFDLVSQMVGNRVSQGQDLLARLTEKGSAGLQAILQMGVQRGFNVLFRAAGLGHSAIDAAAGLGQFVVNRGAAFADGLISRGAGLLQNVIGNVTGLAYRGIGLGTSTAHGAVGILERAATRPVQLLSPYLPPFAVPLANRYLAGAGRIGRTVHDLIDRAGSGATGATGWVSRLLTGATGIGRSIANAGVAFIAGRLNTFGGRVAGMAHRTVDRVAGNTMGFVGRAFNRARSMVQSGASFVSRLLRSPAATVQSGVQSGIAAVGNLAQRTTAMAQGVIDRGASMLGASPTNPVVAGAHAVVDFASQAASRATSVVSGVTDTLFGWLQREGAGPEPTVANPLALAESIRSRDRHTQLPPRAREMLSSQLGFDVSAARIHAGAESNRSARSIGANAFTVGQDIFFRAGEYDPHSTRGQALLAHELTHVMQQSRGTPSAQRFRDSGGDAMEREAQDQGRAMVLAVREQRLGGIDRHDVDIRRADGAVVPEDQSDRLARIQELMEAKVLTKANAAGINRLISNLVQVDVILDLDRLSDEEAAEHWATVVVGAVRTTAEPVKVRSQLAVQPDVRSGLNAEAQARLGQVPGGKAPSDLDLNRRRTQQYAEMYLSNPRVFKWAGMAAFASRLVGQGIAGSQGGRVAGLEMMRRGGPMGMAAGAGLVANPLDRALLEGNKAVYDDIFWLHLAYQQGGIERIREAHASGGVANSVLSAWEMIDEGAQSNDDTKIWQGNRELLRFEQQVTLQPLYDKNPNLFGAMSAAMVSPLPGKEPGARLPYGGEFLQEAKPGSNIVNFDDRWNWIDNHMLPHWQQLETQQPERMRYLLQELGESGGLVPTFEDTDIREGVAKRKNEDLAGVSTDEKVRMVNRLLSGYIADDDVDAAVRLLESTDSEEKVDAIAGGIAESMDGMWSSRQRNRLKMALARARAASAKKAVASRQNTRGIQPPTETPARRTNRRGSRRSNPAIPTRRANHPEPAPTIVPAIPAPAPVDAAHAAALADVAHAQRLALFADSSYEAAGAPPGSTRIDADAAELRRVGLPVDGFHDEDSGFDAALYREESTGRIVLAYRGTESAVDWRTNVGQGLGFNMEQYRRAASLARAVRAAYPDANIEITGHSLGGGLATIGAAATGIRATTFNAANVHPDTYRFNDATPGAVGAGSTNYTVDGEPLSGLQDNAPMIGGAVGAGIGVSGGGGPVGAVRGGMVGYRLGSNIHYSPLRRDVMEARNRGGEEMGTFEHLGGHGMSGVIEALAYRRALLESGRPPSGGE